MIVSQELTYDRPLSSRDGLHPEHRKVLEWVGSGRRVLELGCHTGNLSRWLQEQGCEVTGVELNGTALGHARPFLADAYNADLEDQSLWDRLQSRQFDVVLALHVLEHLSDPWSVLKRIDAVLAKEGELIVGLPNICSATARFEVLFGRFKYETTGVLDRTHLRFFDQTSARELLHGGGFEVREYFGPAREKPIAVLVSKMPLLWRLAPLAARFVDPLFRFSPNLTDTVMDFRCRRMQAIEPAEEAA